MVFWTTLTVALLATGRAIAAPTNIIVTSDSGLNEAAQAHGKYFGSATDDHLFTDPEYAAILGNKKDFGQITPGNAMKWASVEGTQNILTFDDGDRQMAFAENHGQIRRCHNLVWEWQIPGWIATTSWTRDSLIATMTKHITEEVTHYRGQCYAWDVVNEPLFDNGTLRDTIFHRVIGPDYIAIAFKAAAAADPNAKLYFNDYGIESPGSKATGALALVDSLQQAGAPIHGVGFESHFIVGETPCRKDQAAVMAAFASKNVEVAVTELDIRIQDDQVTRATHIQQAVDYASTVGACLDSPNCVGLTVWDFTDKYSWIPTFFTGSGHACPWGKHMHQKRAYNAMMEVFTTGKFTPPSSHSSQLPDQPHWAQCGGSSWTGSTTCAAPFQCHFYNQWYSKCLGSDEL